MANNPFRGLPPVNEILAAAPLRLDADGVARESIVAAVRSELAEVRRRLKEGGAAELATDAVAIAGRAAARLAVESRPRLRPVINATGVVLHTNLGRAPMAAEAAAAARSAAEGYLNLELDLQ